MDPKTKACPSSPKYIPLDTSENDSTKSAIVINTISSERVISSGEQTPLQPTAPPKIKTKRKEKKPTAPPPQRAPNEEDEQVAAPLCFLITMATVIVALVHIWTDDDITKSQPVTNPEIDVSSAVFTLYDSSSRQMKAEVTLNLTKASNCETAFYDNIVVSLFHAEKPLSVAITEPFFQNESNHTMVKAIFPQMNAPAEIPDSELILPGGPNSSLSFEFSFDVYAKGRLWPSINTTEDFIKQSRKIYVWCPNLKVRILAKTGVGMMEGEPAKCKVEGF